MALTSAYILTQCRNALAYHLKHRAKCFVSCLHIRMHLAFIDIHWNFLYNGHCLKYKQLQLTENCIPKFDFCYAISIVCEISEITVKMVCKMTFDDFCRFWRILKSHFRRKTQQSLFSTCFVRPRFRMTGHKVHNIVVSILWYKMKRNTLLLTESLIIC